MTLCKVFKIPLLPSNINLLPETLVIIYEVYGLKSNHLPVNHKSNIPRHCMLRAALRYFYTCLLPVAALFDHFGVWPFQYQSCVDL